MANVIGRLDPTGSQSALSGHASGVTAVEDRCKAALVGKLTVELHELLVSDRVRGVPVEVVRRKTLIEAIDLAVDVVRWDLSPVARVE